MNEENRPRLNIIWQDAKPESPTVMAQVLTFMAAIVVLIVILGGCHP